MRGYHEGPIPGVGAGNPDTAAHVLFYPESKDIRMQANEL